MTTLHSSTDIEVARGLKGVVSHATQLSEVDGQAGRLVIRGYDIRELAGRVTFEEAAYLLWHGDLPNHQQLEACQQQMAAARHLPGPIMDVLRAAVRQVPGMHCGWVLPAFPSMNRMPMTCHRKAIAAWRSGSPPICQR